MHQQVADIQEFTNMLRQYEPLVYKICNLYAVNIEDRKDLFQEIVLQAWGAYPRFRQESAVSTWLYRVALNTAITHKRKQKKYATVLDLDLDLHDEYAPLYSEEHKILHQLIGNLPALDKALVLLYMEDRSHQEIADIMGISTSNVGTKLGRMKDKLKKLAQPFLTK